MAQTAIRDYLRSRGLKDEEITYDNGTVYAKGRRFLDATPQADNKTYSDSRTLDNAYSNYDIQDQLAQLRTRAAQPNQQLTAMQQALQERMNRQPQQYSYNADADPTFQSAANAVRSGVSTAQANTNARLRATGQGKSSWSETVSNQIANKAEQDIANNIRPQYEQLAYQRYMGQQQQENQQLANMMNAYKMYVDQDQQQFGNTLQALGMQNQYTQQQFANERATADDALRQRQANLNAYLQTGQATGYSPIEGPKEDWRLLFQGPGSDPTQFAPNLVGQKFKSDQDQQQFLRGVQEAGVTGSYKDKPTMQKLAQDFNQKQAMEQLAISRMNAGTSAMSARNSAGNARINQLLDIYRATGQAPSGLESYGVQPGTAYYNPNQSTPKINTNQFESEVIANLNKMTPDQQQRFFDEEAATLINSVGLSGMNKIYNQYFDKDGKPKRK